MNVNGTCLCMSLYKINYESLVCKIKQKGRDYILILRHFVVGVHGLRHFEKQLSTLVSDFHVALRL